MFVTNVGIHIPKYTAPPSKLNCNPHDFVIERWLVGTSVATPVILTEGVSGFFFSSSGKLWHSSLN
jgi:hypothetical protein